MLLGGKWHWLVTGADAAGEAGHAFEELSAAFDQSTHGHDLRRRQASAVFAIVWAGFVLMAEGPDDRGGGRAMSAVVMAVVGLVLVLLAKGVATLLSSGLVPFSTP